MPRAPRRRPPRSSGRGRAASRRGHEFAERRTEPVVLTRQLAEIEQDEVRAGADGDARRLETEGARRAVAHADEQRLGEVEEARLDEVRMECGERRLEPVTPNGAASKGTSFSCRACGAWSEATLPMSPLRRARRAPPGRARRSGGFIFRFGSSLRTASSVSTRWCGVTSAVAATPASRAHERLDRLARGQVHEGGAAAARMPPARGRARP